MPRSESAPKKKPGRSRTELAVALTKPVAKTKSTNIFTDAKKAARFNDGFDNFVSRLGLNNDNTLSAGVYTFNLVTRNRLLLEAAYRGSWVVGSIVDSPAVDMTRAGIDITTVKGQDDVRQIRNDISRLQIWQSLCLLAKWGRLYGGAIGVIQIEGQDLSTPLDLDTVGKDQFQGIVVYDRWQLNPQLFDIIDSGPEMGLPAYYDIVNNPTSVDPHAPSATGQQKVHHSRCIRYTGFDLPYFQAITEMMWGESIIERLFDRLISFDNATLSCASLIDRANLRTIGVDGLREIIAAGGEAFNGLVEMFEMVRRMQVNEGITLIDKNDEFTATAYTFSGLSDMMLQFAQQLSGGSEIPLIRLFCQSPAGLNATGDNDLRMYYDNINSQQELKFRNPWEVLLKVLWRSAFGKAAPDDLEFSFTPLWQESPTDKAANTQVTTNTILAAFEAGVIDKATALKELRDASGETGLFSNITDEQIKEAEEEPPPMPEGDFGSEPGQPGEPGQEPDSGDEPAQEEKPAEPDAPAPKEKAKDAKPLTAQQKIQRFLNAGKDSSIYEPDLSEEEIARARARFRKPDDRPNPSLETKEQQSEKAHAREKAMREKAAKR